MFVIVPVVSRVFELCAVRPQGLRLARINSTSLGLHSDDALPMALDHVSKHTVIADIIMVPADTKWLKDAVSRGLPIHYGRHMLDYQIDLIGRFIAAF